MRNTKKVNRISVRLTEEASNVINELKKDDVNISSFINDLITANSSNSIDNINNVEDLYSNRDACPFTYDNSSIITFDKAVLIHISNMQSLVEESDDLFKEEMRKELNELCRVLKSSRKLI